MYTRLPIVLVAMTLAACENNDSNESTSKQDTAVYANLIPVLSGEIPLEVPSPPADIIHDPVLTRPFFDTFRGSLLLHYLGPPLQ